MFARSSANELQRCITSRRLRCRTASRCIGYEHGQSSAALQHFHWGVGPAPAGDARAFTAIAASHDAGAGGGGGRGSHREGLQAPFQLPWQRGPRPAAQVTGGAHPSQLYPPTARAPLTSVPVLPFRIFCTRSLGSVLHDMALCQTAAASCGSVRAIRHLAAFSGFPNPWLLRTVVVQDPIFPLLFHGAHGCMRTQTGAGAHKAMCAARRAVQGIRRRDWGCGSRLAA